MAGSSSEPFPLRPAPFGRERVETLRQRREGGVAEGISKVPTSAATAAAAATVSQRKILTSATTACLPKSMKTPPKRTIPGRRAQSQCAQNALGMASRPTHGYRSMTVLSKTG